ncbi:galactose mutarotase-like protein [Rickenella mellea]|uniref:Galactose mutarotase-like protein n=1 Tax=Rickenella mellea TaxID=50990 RepID=A0A4Y7QDN3_9AGAM|nr:galactose mutarotase-like protein [Rickenella mellea]
MASPAFTPILLALPSLTPSLAIEILPHGLTVHKIYVQADGRTHDLVIGPEDAIDFQDPNHAFFNTIVGRYSNRVPVGKYELSRNGVTSAFTALQNESPKVSIHGGPKGFDQAEWEVVEPEISTLFSDAEKSTILTTIPAAAVFRLTSEDGDQGFPGKLLVEVLVGLLNPGQTKIVTPKDEYPLGSIVFVYRAKLLTEGKKVVTPVNLTQHWGFNLDASLKEKSSGLSVNDHVLTMKASHTVDIDNDLLSTGKLNAVVNTHHHHVSKPIGKRFPDKGYDEFYVFESSTDGTTVPTRVPLESLPSLNLLQSIVDPNTPGTGTPVVKLESPKSGLKLAFESNQSGVQFYTANFVSKDTARKKIHGGTGKKRTGDGYGPQSAAFLEFHEPHAAWLHPDTTPTGYDTLLTSDELYNNFVKVDVTYHNPQAL